MVGSESAMPVQARLAALFEQPEREQNGCRWGTPPGGLRTNRQGFTTQRGTAWRFQRGDLGFRRRQRKSHPIRRPCLGTGKRRQRRDDARPRQAGRLHCAGPARGLDRALALALARARRCISQPSSVAASGGSLTATADPRHTHSKSARRSSAPGSAYRRCRVHSRTMQGAAGLRFRWA
jgi:hypothetical protein